MQQLVKSGFILHSIPGGSWPANFGACFTFNFKRRCMYIFMCTYSADGPFHEDIDIGKFGTADQSPFMLPGAMTRLNLDARARALDGIKNDIYQLECALGVRKDHDMHVDVRTLDYAELSRMINALNAGLAWTMHSSKQTMRLLDFMDTVAVRYKSMSLTHHYSLDEADTVKRKLLSSHAYLRSWNQGLIDRVEYLTSRLQASSQSVSGFGRHLLFRYPNAVDSAITVQAMISSYAQKAPKSS